nr:MAG TPA: hypothetical protein [Caudoviricetes sp.]
MKLLYLRYENTHSDFIIDASTIKTIVPVGRYQNASFMIYDKNDETYEFDHIYYDDEFIRVYEMTTLYKFLMDKKIFEVG